MNTTGHLPLTLTKTALFTVCAVCWALQSIPALMLYLEGADIVKQRSVPAVNGLALPRVLFCNRFPFTHAGLASLGSPQFQLPTVLSYLRQWLSLFAEPPEESLMGGERQGAEEIISKLMPNGRLKQRLDQMMPQCQDMVASCVLGAHQLSGFDCCRMVQPWLATPRAGICWPFLGNLSSVQGPLDSPRGLQITFQISRNSFQTGALSVHPGFDVHLVPADMHSRLRVAASLGVDSAFPLDDKRALRLDIRKEVEGIQPDPSMSIPAEVDDPLQISYNSPNICPTSAEFVQKGQIVPSASAGLLCLVEKAIDHCACVPMIVVLWTLQNDLDSTFLRHFNASTICTVGEFEHCVHPYIEFGLSPAWAQYPVPEEAPPQLKSAIEMCRNRGGAQQQVVCQQKTRFPAHRQERELPAEYRNTQDFVSRVSVSFDTFVVTELFTSKEMDLYRLLSTLGYNLWWFAIGHLLWSACRCFRCGHSPSASSPSLLKGSVNRVDPKSPMVPPQPQPHQSPPAGASPPPAAPNGRQLPPLAIAGRNRSANGTIGIGSSILEEEEGEGRRGRGTEGRNTDDE